jgi:hypothetical protein
MNFSSSMKILHLLNLIFHPNFIEAKFQDYLYLEIISFYPFLFPLYCFDNNNFFLFIL